MTLGQEWGQALNKLNKSPFGPWGKEGGFLKTKVTGYKRKDWYTWFPGIKELCSSKYKNQNSYCLYVVWLWIRNYKIKIFNSLQKFNKADRKEHVRINCIFTRASNRNKIFKK